VLKISGSPPHLSDIYRQDFQLINLASEFPVVEGALPEQYELILCLVLITTAVLVKSLWKLTNSYGEL
jgi:hypothetical protein